MKKIIALLLSVIAVLSAMVLSGCNKQMVDLTYSYEYAIIGLPNGEVVEGKVSSWTDYEDGDQLQVKINGKTYLEGVTLSRDEFFAYQQQGADISTSQPAPGDLLAFWDEALNMTVLLLLQCLQTMRRKAWTIFFQLRLSCLRERQALIMSLCLRGLRP